MRPRLFGWLIPTLVAMMLAFGPQPGHAQAPPVGTPPGLTLTPAQQARAQARQQQFSKDMTTLKANQTLTPAQKTAKAQSLYKALDTDMLAILTPAERSKVLAQRQALSQKRQTFLNAHQAQIAQGKTLAARLNKSLTTAQKSQLSSMQQQLAAQGQQLSADQSMAPQAKQAKWAAEQQAAQTKMMAVLTPSQKADFAKMQQIQKQLMAAAASAGPAK